MLKVSDALPFVGLFIVAGIPLFAIAVIGTITGPFFFWGMIAVFIGGAFLYED